MKQIIIYLLFISFIAGCNKIEDEPDEIIPCTACEPCVSFTLDGDNDSAIFIDKK